MGSRARTGLAALAALTLLSVAGCAGNVGGSGAETSQGLVTDVRIEDDDGLNGIVLPQPYDVADVALDDTSGEPYHLSTDPDAPLTLVFFGYINCPDICQVTMANIASAFTRLDADHRAKVDMLLVTTDPARDDEAAMRSYLDRFDPDFGGLTGRLPRIVDLAEAFDVIVEKGRRLPSGGYEVGHGTQIVGVRPDGTAPYVWTEGTDPAALAEDLIAVVDGTVRAP